MIETVLSVVHDTEEGTYTVNYHGREFALGSSPVLEQDYNRFAPFDWAYYRPKYRISFSCFEMPPAPAPKPKRTWASVMGLRRPNR